MANGERTDEFFRKRFTAERKRREWSQADVEAQFKARGVHVPATAVSKLESGARSVRLDEAVAIADMFEMSVDTLLGRGAGLEDDLAYALRAVKESARRIAAQLAPLMHEIDDAGTEAFRYTFAGRSKLDEFIGHAVKNIGAAMFSLQLVDLYTDAEAALPEGTVVGVDDYTPERRRADELAEAEQFREAFDKLKTIPGGDDLAARALASLAVHYSQGGVVEEGK